jgi:hypothetical protein
MVAIRPLLLLTPLLAACSQGPSDSVADLQQRLTAAEARADAAEKRVKNLEALAAQHSQEPVKGMEPPAPQMAEADDSQFGQPAIDTAPIDPVPAMPDAVAEHP